ncbi:MAG: FAD-dependent monooxygenase [Phycisphaerae bacterium]|nr:FAD-dependent monooxygenase [Gemmatimonadaceae bacterium]
MKSLPPPDSLRATHRNPYDVAILGGGPAGTAAARMLSLWGHRVLLLTRPPRGPALAESLTPSCGKLLAQLGVLDAMNRAGFVRSTGHTVKWGNSDVRVESFGHGELGWQLLSSQLDRVLLRQAQLAGVKVHRHAKVRRVMLDSDGHWRTSYEERGTLRHASSRWVIDCTGRAGLMSRAGSGRVSAGPRTMAILGLWERRPDWQLANDSHTCVESYPGGWVWSVPVSRVRRQITVMLDPSRTDVAEGRRLALTYRDELARTSMIGAMTERARAIGVPWARDASSYTRETQTRARLLVAGDAASFVDPLSSFGVKKALASGWLSAVVVHSVLSDANIEGPALALFSARERAMVAGLRRQQGVLAQEAAIDGAAEFWGGRLGPNELVQPGEPNLTALRDDTEVVAAFQAIRGAATLRLQEATGVVRKALPVVEGHQVALRDHLVVPAFPDGIRYLRNVNVVTLAALAPRHTDVPSLYLAYCREAGDAPIADLLGALAVLVAKGILRFA